MTKIQENAVVKGLAQLLANTYVLYLKTQNFHWNVRSPHFYALHKFFEEQYQALASAIDEIAERIRALNAFSPASFKEFLDIASLSECTEHNLNAEKMLTLLLKDHQFLAKELTQLFEVAEDANDETTLDFFIGRKYEHDKTAWMIKSTLEA